MPVEAAHLALSRRLIFVHSLLRRIHFNSRGINALLFKVRNGVERASVQGGFKSLEIWKAYNPSSGNYRVCFRLFDKRNKRPGASKRQAG